MKKKLIIKYISIIFVIATFVGSLHQHNDFQEHNDCQICTISHNVSDINTPTDINYLTLFTVLSEATLANLPNLQIEKHFFTFSARAPPVFS